MSRAQILLSLHSAIVLASRATALRLRRCPGLISCSSVKGCHQHQTPDLFKLRSVDATNYNRGDGALCDDRPQFVSSREGGQGRGGRGEVEDKKESTGRTEAQADRGGSTHASNLKDFTRCERERAGAGQGALEHAE